MSFWILYGLLTSFLVSISYMVKNKYQRIISYIMLVLMILVSGFRYRIGYDYDQYMNMYSWISYDPNMVWPEPSFQILCQILRTLGFEFQMLFLLYAMVSLIFFYKGLCYYLDDDYRQISVALGIFTLGTIGLVGLWFSFTMIRQFAAMAIIFWGIKYIFAANRSFIKFFFSISLATFFHTSSVIFIVLYFVPTKLSKKKIFILILGIPFIVKLILSLPSVQLIMALSDRLSGYSLEKTNIDEVSISSYIMTLAMLTFVFFKLKLTNEKRNILLLLTSLGLSLKIFLSGLYGLDRIASEFLIFFYPTLVLCLSDIRCGYFAHLGLTSLIILMFFVLNIHMIIQYPDTLIAKTIGGSHANIDYVFNTDIRNGFWSFYDLLK